MQLLLIELRAEIGFASTERLLRDPELFGGRRAQALQAAELVERIRQDEQLHLSSLRVVLGEAREFDFRALDGTVVRGAQLIDPYWQGLVRWATIEQPPLAAERARALLERRILAHPDGERILDEFRALAA
jgi:hypothetical protein